MDIDLLLRFMLCVLMLYYAVNVLGDLWVLKVQRYSKSTAAMVLIAAVWQGAGPVTRTTEALQLGALVFGVVARIYLRRKYEW